MKRALPALIGAIVVIAVGVVVGAVIGGKTKTDTQTVTVAGPVRTVQVPSTTPLPVTTTPATSPSAPPSPPAPAPTGVDLLVNETPQPSSPNAGTIQLNRDDMLNGAIPANSVTVPQMFSTCNNKVVDLAYPTRGHRRFTGTLGWSSSSPSDVNAVLDLRMDTTNGPIIKSIPFNTPGTGTAVAVKLPGVSDLVLDFHNRGEACADTTRWRFVLGNGRFSG